MRNDRWKRILSELNAFFLGATDYHESLSHFNRFYCSERLHFNFTSCFALKHCAESVFIATAAFVHERFAFLFRFVVSKLAEAFVASSDVDFVETASYKIVKSVISLEVINDATYEALSNCFQLYMSKRTRSKYRIGFRCRRSLHRWIFCKY